MRKTNADCNASAGPVLRAVQHEVILDERIGGVSRYVSVKRGQRLMDIPEEIQKCVVFLGVQTSEGTEWLGTGFFFAVPLPSPAEKEIVSYLVTARHVIKAIEAISPKREIIVRLNLISGTATTVAIKANQWHCAEGKDVAVILFTYRWMPDMDHMSIPLETVVTPERVEHEGMGPGDDIFFPGLFVEHSGARRSIPIIRAGTIAAMPEEPISMSIGGGESVRTDAFLVESRSIGGLSGSPVFIHMGDTRRSENAVILSPGNPRIYLLGLMHGHWDEERHEKPKRTKKKSGVRRVASDVALRFRQEVNMGVASVVPIPAIIHTLNHPAMKQEREAVAREVAHRRMPVPDVQ